MPRYGGELRNCHDTVKIPSSGASLVAAPKATTLTWLRLSNPSTRPRHERPAASPRFQIVNMSFADAVYRRGPPGSWLPTESVGKFTYDRLRPATDVTVPPAGLAGSHERRQAALVLAGVLVGPARASAHTVNPRSRSHRRRATAAALSHPSGTQFKGMSWASERTRPSGAMPLSTMRRATASAKARHSSWQPPATVQGCGAVAPEHPTDVVAHYGQGEQVAELVLEGLDGFAAGAWPIGHLLRPRPRLTTLLRCDRCALRSPCRPGNKLWVRHSTGGGGLKSQIAPAPRSWSRQTRFYPYGPQCWHRTP